MVILPNRAKAGFIQSESVVQVFEVSSTTSVCSNNKILFQMERNSDDRRVIGEPWSYLGIKTFVYGSTVDKAIEAAQRLENLRKGSTCTVGLSRESTLKSTTQRI